MNASHYAVIGALSILLVGCESKEKTENWDLVTATNGLVYRINKKTGEVSVVAGTQMTKLDDLREQKKDSPKKTYLRDWPVQKIKPLGDISLKLKTTWRDGKLHYILAVSPYSSQIQKEAENSFSTARFNLILYDADGFELFELPIKISEMTGVVDDTGKRDSMRANGSVVCSVDTYEALSGAGAGWAGFPKESP